MSEFKNISGIACILDIDNIDTDQIIPTEYLKSIKKFGFGEFLFDGWRYHDIANINTPTSSRSLNQDFILNQAPFNESKIIITGKNFGCGSSREHAVWALRDFGIETVIAESFGDIFYNNCFKNGVLPIALNQDKLLMVKDHVSNESKLHISLVDKNIVIKNERIAFEVDSGMLDMIITGQDEVDITLSISDKIKSYESNRLKQKPWLN
ncbi:MAG: 3-isopropylmalate dehydratase small subunit [Gammaproteobacteria bacterium]|nr:3-isopropylmalate dehydratase small subunit [Gammaproteobacteria bacterium]|tara:strand:- start:6022 stop:6648 length:627 start_codon:yes stop_codon:yes gene_type:complete